MLLVYMLPAPAQAFEAVHNFCSAHHLPYFNNAYKGHEACYKLSG